MMPRPRPRDRRRRPGYTLVEITFGAAVGAVVMLGILTLLKKGIAIFGRTNETMDSLQSATMISEIMHRDLRYMTIPMIAPPGRTQDAGEGGQSDESAIDLDAPDPNDPTAPSTPDPAAADPDAEAPPEAIRIDPTKFQTLVPFTAWNDAERRPEITPELALDLTDPAQKPSPGDFHPNHFVFYRSQIGESSGGLFGIGGSPRASYTVERVWYRARLSNKYADQGLYVLRRDAEPVTITVSGSGADRREEVSPPFDPSRETDEGRLFRSFYFKRLVISLHDAPEAGIAGGADAAATPPPGGEPQVPLDRLYFVRLMIAGASAGSGARVVQTGEDGQPSQASQKLDLLVNLIHLDGVSDRFRKRSLAMNWNAELPTAEDL